MSGSEARRWSAVVSERVASERSALSLPLDYLLKSVGAFLSVHTIGIKWGLGFLVIIFYSPISPPLSVLFVLLAKFLYEGMPFAFYYASRVELVNIRSNFPYKSLFC